MAPYSLFFRSGYVETAHVVHPQEVVVPMIAAAAIVPTSRLRCL